MKKAFQLKQERQALIDEARKLIELAEDEKRDLTEDEQRAHDERMKKIKDLSKQITEREALEELEEPDEEDLPNQERNTKPSLDDEYRELGASIIEKRDYTSTMNEGVFQPTQVETKVREGIAVLSPIRNAANVTTTGSNLVIPVDAGDVSVGIIAEGGAYPDGGGSLKPVKFKPLKVGAIVKLTDEALSDVPANLAQNVVRQLSRATAKKENRWFAIGNGTSEPEGILTGASEGLVADAVDAITGVEIRKYLTSLDSSLLPFAMGLCTRNTMGILMDLTDKNKGIDIRWDSVLKCYLVQGIPFHINQNMPEIGAGTKPMVIGDVQNFYEIKDRTGYEVKVLTEKYSDVGKVGYRFTFRTDAHVMESEAFKYFQMKSA